MLLLHDGSQVLLREAGPSDVPLVDALHARCSPASRRARFLSPSPRLNPQQLRALVDPVGGRSVLALTRDGGSAVGLADLRLSDPVSPTPTATFGVLVEDTWQHRGLGTALVRRVAETAEELGMRELIGTVPADEVRITRLLRRAGLRPTAVLADGTLQLNVPLETPAAMA